MAHASALERIRTMNRTASPAAAAALLLLLSAAAPAQPAPAQPSPAQPSRTPDWPCVQILVPDLSPGQIWAGPPVEPPPPWRDDPLASRAVHDLAQEGVEPEERLDRLVEEAGPRRDEVLTLTFAGVFETLDAERAAAIASIKRYARGQTTLSQRIAGVLGEMEALPDGDPQRDALVAELAMDRRILEERRRSLGAVCDQPVAVERRLGDLARAIAARMEG